LVIASLFLGRLLGFLLSRGFWEKNRVNVRKNSTLGNGDRSEEFVEFLIVSDSKLDVSWDDSGLLVITSGVTGKLKDFSSKVFKDSSKVDRGSGSDTGSVFSLL
jgi:hypothetical protein